MSRMSPDLDAYDVLRRYRSGHSVKKIADDLNVSRNVIDTRLKRLGVTPRGRSEAETLKWSQMSVERRARQVSCAHIAATGRKHSIEERAKMAQARERNVSGVSPTEFGLAKMLSARDIATIPQLAIGPYNCDLGAQPVAVEVFGGEWHFGGRHMLRTPRRFRYLMKAGWHIVVVHVSPRRFPLTDVAADYVAAYIQQARRNPSSRCEYRVIRGTGELMSSGSADDDKISIVHAVTHGRDTVTGRYYSVPR